MTLVEYCPFIRGSVGVACVYGDHRGGYTHINPESSFPFMYAAKQSLNQFFHQDMEKWAAEQDIDIEHFSNWYGELDIMQEDLEPTRECMTTFISECQMMELGGTTLLRSLGACWPVSVDGA
jgi:hypothetical protein